MYSIQGIKAVGKSLPQGLKTILKKGGHNYSSIVNNWAEIVGKKTSQKNLYGGIFYLDNIDSLCNSFIQLPD